eukprot:7856412-Pyramimonas_sp.AAC.2
MLRLVANCWSEKSSSSPRPPRALGARPSALSTVSSASTTRPSGSTISPTCSSTCVPNRRSRVRTRSITL